MSSIAHTSHRPSTDSQDETINFLKSLAPTVIETHISLVFLDEQYAYKLKKAVKLPFVDFSHVEQRLHYCHEELKLNRRTAPEIYLDVLTIYRNDKGALSFEDHGESEVVDAVLKMKRFDSQKLLSKLAEKKQLSNHMMAELAHGLANFHKQAAVTTDYQGAKRLNDIIELNQLSEATVNKVLAHKKMSELNQLLLNDIAQHSSILNTRAANGKVRHCHGDLHLNNICLWREVPTPFDCLEFNESMATTDVLYDLAFLLMDLWRHQQYDLANFLMNRYMEHSDETDGLVLLPLFMSLRASIRAMIIATQSANSSDPTARKQYRRDVENYLNLAFKLLKRPKTKLVVIGGLSGSGKSTLATALAPYIGAAPGARVLSTDRIRKQLFNVAAEEKLPADSYTEASSNMVYRRQRELATTVIQNGHSAIADGVFAKAWEREAIAQCALDIKSDFKGIWLETSSKELIERVANRKNDPSDATIEVVKKQLQMQHGLITWPRLNSTQTLENLIPQALSLVKGLWPW